MDTLNVNHELISETMRAIIAGKLVRDLDAFERSVYRIASAPVQGIAIAELRQRAYQVSVMASMERVTATKLYQLKMPDAARIAVESERELNEDVRAMRAAIAAFGHLP